MRFLAYYRSIACGRNERLGFPIWLPLLLGLALFWAGHLLAAERHHRPAHHRTTRNLVNV
jgi:hypothetical protein